MSYKLNPKWMEKLLPAQQKFALEKRGAEFLHKFLWKHGHHLYIVGTTESGKTQKAYWLVRWIKTTKETVVWLDSAKNGEMLPLLEMGVPVRIICPKGCDVILTEYNQETHKYERIKNHPEIVHAADPGSAWWAVKRGYINIMCFRRAFGTPSARIGWMAELFKTLSIWTGKGIMPKILPMALFGDEAHWFIAGEKITSDQERSQLSELLTELSLEDRAYGIRLVLIAQGWKNLPPGARENLINVILCRGAKVDASENNTLSRFNDRTSFYRPDQGMFVFAGGFTYPKDHPWPFPFFKKPKIRVEYKGEFDDKPASMIAEEEIETELIPALDKYQAIAQGLEGYEIPQLISRWEGVPNDTT